MSDRTSSFHGSGASGPSQVRNPADEGWTIRDDEPGLMTFVGPLWQRNEEEGPAFGFLVEEKHLNRRGVVHGGMLMTFADQALGLTSRDLNEDLPQATVQLDTQFIAPVMPGEFVEARAQMLRRTRSIIFMKGILTVDERVVASAQGVWKILRTG